MFYLQHRASGNVTAATMLRLRCMVRQAMPTWTEAKVAVFSSSGESYDSDTSSIIASYDSDTHSSISMTPPAKTTQATATTTTSQPATRRTATTTTITPPTTAVTQISPALSQPHKLLGHLNPTHIQHIQQTHTQLTISPIPTLSHTNIDWTQSPHLAYKHTHHQQQYDPYITMLHNTYLVIHN